MADMIKKVVIRIGCSGQDIPLKTIEKRLYFVRKRFPKAEIFIRIVNR